MSNARIQFSLASEEVWNAYNPLLKEGEIVTVLKANKKVKLVQGKVGGSTYSESTVIWDEDEAQIIMSRSEAAAVTAIAQAAAAKNYSENVNVFTPSVSSDGVLSWTNKAGLANPPSVNIKGEKGDPGPQGPKGDGAITVDAVLSATSTNPIQNKTVKTAIDTVKNNMTQGFQTVTASIPTKVSDLENDAGYLNMGTLPIFPSTESANTWKERQIFKEAVIKEATLAKARISKELYQSEYINGTTVTPTKSTICLVTTGATTLDMTTIVAECLGDNRSSTVFTAYITSSADYPLTITNAGTIKYIGSASDVAITSAGLLLNILMMKDAEGNVTSIVQASKLEGGA